MKIIIQAAVEVEATEEELGRLLDSMGLQTDTLARFLYRATTYPESEEFKLTVMGQGGSVLSTKGGLEW